MHPFFSPPIALYNFSSLKATDVSFTCGKPRKQGEFYVSFTANSPETVAYKGPWAGPITMTFLKSVSDDTKKLTLLYQTGRIIMASSDDKKQIGVPNLGVEE